MNSSNVLFFQKYTVRTGFAVHVKESSICLIPSGLRGMAFKQSH
jgi:hypothetical protein